MSKKAVTVSSSDEIARFLDDMKAAVPGAQARRGRLIFAMDATASREPSWDRAIAVQSAMFAEADKLGGLGVQLVFYRGFGECKASRWTGSAAELIGVMTKVRCLAGRTQIYRILRHALNGNKEQKIDALVFVGDACEENIDELGELAGQLGLFGTPAFMFQEGGDPAAARAFSSIARLTSGAHLQLREGSSDELRALLRAVAAFASGGQPALAKLAVSSPQARLLLEDRGRR